MESNFMSLAVMNTSLDATLNRLRIQFDIDSEPYRVAGGEKMQWALTCKSTPVFTMVRVKELTSGIHKTVLTMKPQRIGFLATLAFVEIMKKVIDRGATAGHCCSKTSQMES